MSRKFATICLWLFNKIYPIQLQFVTLLPHVNWSWFWLVYMNEGVVNKPSLGAIDSSFVDKTTGILFPCIYSDLLEGWWSFPRVIPSSWYDTRPAHFPLCWYVIIKVELHFWSPGKSSRADIVGGDEHSAHQKSAFGLMQVKQNLITKKIVVLVSRK